MSAPNEEFFNHVVNPYSLELDGTKVWWYQDRIKKLMNGEKIAPVTVDGAWTRKCSAACDFCYAQLQSSDGGEITKEVAWRTLEDMAEVGVKGFSLISDGESTEVPFFADSVAYGVSLGLQLGTSSNGVKLTRPVLEKILPHLSYLRFNFSGGEKHRWAQIMGLKQALFDRVVDNIKTAMEIVRRDKLSCNVNMQFVVDPKNADQIIPFAKLASEIRCHYAIMKHTADSRDGDLGVDYRRYSSLFPIFEEAESYSDDDFRVAVKWSRIQDEGKRSYKRCYATPLILQFSGNGTVAPCGQTFNTRYQKLHSGNIITERFKDIIFSDRYWEVVHHLASDEWDSTISCGPNCLQHNSNVYLDRLAKGEVQLPNIANMPEPAHIGFL